MEFPIQRPRRLRRTPALRSLFRETAATPSDLVLPLFVHELQGNAAIDGMPGVERLDLDGVAKAASALFCCLAFPAARTQSGRLRSPKTESFNRHLSGSGLRSATRWC
jgi:hypothetical protein